MPVKAVQSVSPSQEMYGPVKSEQSISLASKIYNLFLSFLSFFIPCLHKQEESSNSLKDKTLEIQKESQQPIKTRHEEPNLIVEWLFSSCEKRRREDVITEVSTTSSQVKEACPELSELLDKISAEIARLSAGLSSSEFSTEVACILDAAKKTEIGTLNPGTFVYLASKILPQNHREEIDAIFA
jgi:hypothetical protein